MSAHKFDTDREQQDGSSLAVGLAFQHELYNLADTVVTTRAIRALKSVAARYPVHRSLRCAARRKLEEVFDDLALQSGFDALRLDTGALLLDGPGVFIKADGTRKTGYCSCEFEIWTGSRQRVEEIKGELLRIVGERYAREQLFTIDWYFMSRSGLVSTAFDEIATDTLYDEAYPTLGGPVSRFIGDYLAVGETVLILQGPPGSGKTKLVRAILAALSRRKRDSAKIMYTADKKALESDKVFVEFITGEHDAFVIEDADHLLLARSNGNQDLHRFLAIADGVMRAQGRKIIFTTNLPNVSDLDEALLRPGRCFATVTTRGLAREEAAALIARVVTSEAQRPQALDAAFAPGTKSTTVANIYRACAFAENNARKAAMSPAGLSS